MSKKIGSLEEDNEQLRKILIDKVMNLENDLIEDLKSALSKISIKDNQFFIDNLRKLYKELKIVNWLTQISSMGKVIANYYERTRE